ncbi:MAG: type II and III secretion system protein family protein [Phycisphaerae bacterium]
MMTSVMEDRRSVWGIGGVTLLSTLLMHLPVAQAQRDDPPERFSAQVVDLSDSTARVTVPLNRSITVDTNVEISSADVIARQFADVQLISPKRLLITGQRYGSTGVILGNQDGRQFVFNVDVELDLEYLNDTLRKIDTLGDVSATSVKGHIVLTGNASNADRSLRMAEMATLFLPANPDGTPLTTVRNHVEVAGEQQVMIRCVVAEVSRGALRQLGINGVLFGDNFSDVFAVNQIAGINPANIGAAAGALVTQDVPFLTGESGIPLGTTPTFSLGFPNLQAQFFLKAMADNTLLGILAEPNLVATSGETATFLVGGEFPIPVPQGNQQVTIEFREFGIRLNFTPVVRGEQMVRLRVAPEVSELDFTTAVQIDGFVVPGLTSRATETTVEVGAGQTLALSGLLSETTRGLASRLPGAGDIPVLGALFRSVEYERQMTELIVMVTPEIVSPLDAHQKFTLPTDMHAGPDEMELYMLGLIDSLEKTPGREVDGEASEEHVHHHEEHDPDAPQQKGEVRSYVPMVRSQPEETSVHGPWGLVKAASRR